MSAELLAELDSDQTYQDNLAAARRRHRQGKIDDHMLCHIEDHLQRSALKRQGLALHRGTVVVRQRRGEA